GRAARSTHRSVHAFAFLHRNFNNASARHPQNAVVVAIGDVEGIVRGEGDAVGAVEFALQGVGTEGGAGSAGAGDEGEAFVAGVEAADDVVFGVGDEDVAVAVEAEVLGTLEGF